MSGFLARLQSTAAAEVENGFSFEGSFDEIMQKFVDRVKADPTGLKSNIRNFCHSVASVLIEQGRYDDLEKLFSKFFEAFACYTNFDNNKMLEIPTSSRPEDFLGFMVPIAKAADAKHGAGRFKALLSSKLCDVLDETFAAPAKPSKKDVFCAAKHVPMAPFLSKTSFYDPEFSNFGNTKYSTDNYAKNMIKTIMGTFFEVHDWTSIHAEPVGSGPAYADAKAHIFKDPTSARAMIYTDIQDRNGEGYDWMQSVRMFRSGSGTVYVAHFSHDSMFFVGPLSDYAAMLQATGEDKPVHIHGRIGAQVKGTREMTAGDAKKVIERMLTALATIEPDLATLLELKTPEPQRESIGQRLLGKLPFFKAEKG